MLKQLLSVFCFFYLTCSLSAGVKAMNWMALEKEACILEHTIDDCQSAFFPDKNLEDTDPETKISEIGIFHSASLSSIIFYPEIILLTPGVKIVSSFPGYIKLANAP